MQMDKIFETVMYYTENRIIVCMCYRKCFNCQPLLHCAQT